MHDPFHPGYPEPSELCLDENCRAWREVNDTFAGLDEFAPTAPEGHDPDEDLNPVYALHNGGLYWATGGEVVAEHSLGTAEWVIEKGRYLYRTPGPVVCPGTLVVSFSVWIDFELIYVDQAQEVLFQHLFTVDLLDSSLANIHSSTQVVGGYSQRGGLSSVFYEESGLYRLYERPFYVPEGVNPFAVRVKPWARIRIKPGGPDGEDADSVFEAGGLLGFGLPRQPGNGIDGGGRRTAGIEATFDPDC